MPQPTEIRNVVLINDPGTFAIFTHAMVAFDLRNAFLISPWNWDELLAQGRKFFSAEPLKFDQEALPILVAAKENNRLWLKVSVEESINPSLQEWGYPPAANALFAVIRGTLLYRELARMKIGLRPLPTNPNHGWMLDYVLVEEEFYV